MGTHVFKLPDIGEGVVEGEVVQWHVSVGDVVKEDDPIVDVMTDKAAVTIPSPVGGVVSSLSGEVGDMVAVGSALVEFDSDDTPSAAEPVEVIEPEVEAVPEPEPEPEAEPASEPEPELEPEPAPAPMAPSGKALASPALRRRAREAGIDIAQISGSGPSGRIRNADLDAFIAAMVAIAEEAKSDPATVRGAPHSTFVARLDEARAARKPILRWDPELSEE